MTSVIHQPIVSLRYVKLSDLVIDHKNWTNPRTITGLEDAEIAELGADIKLRGIQVPLVVQKVKASGGGVTDLVLEGQRRVLAATEVLPKHAEIPVVDRSAEPIELTLEVADALMLDMLAVGTQRASLSSFELSEVAERLRKRGRTLAEIGRAIGRHESWVSKILKARESASTKLVAQWRKGQVTDEQFKDLATVKDPVKQTEAIKEVTEARKSGDHAEARTRAKELSESFRAGNKAAAKESKANGVNGHAVRGPQEDLFDKKAARAAEVKRAPSRIVLEEIVSLAEKRSPTHDYVKGIMHGVQIALGAVELDELGKPWKAYLARIDGSGKPKKAKKTKRPTQARKPVKKAKKGKKGKRR